MGLFIFCILLHILSVFSAYSAYFFAYSAHFLYIQCISYIFGVFLVYSAYVFAYSFSKFSKSGVLKEFNILVQCTRGRLWLLFSSRSSFANNWLQTISRASFCGGPPALILSSRPSSRSWGLVELVEGCALMRFLGALYRWPIISRHIVCVGHIKYAKYVEYVEFVKYAEYAEYVKYA